MSVGHPTPEDDLAFIRRLTSPDLGEAWRRGFGFIYATWGLAFAAPLLFEWARVAGYLPLPAAFWLYATATATLLLITFTVWTARRSRPTVGHQPRALNAIFAGVGWANVAVLAALIAVSVKLQDTRLLMLHAVVVFAFQGSAWYAVWALQKRLWTGLVAAGWFVMAVALGLTVDQPASFILIAALGLLLLMTLPGLLMMRRPRA
ncbi:hypothetical protein [Phenylobacterium sp.]|uniref:hypothetical protein n=1 Tax=Phenylobacterium sp. TaxID=1871053 RepID=UPI00301CE95A